MIAKKADQKLTQMKINQKKEKKLIEVKSLDRLHNNTI